VKISVTMAMSKKRVTAVSSIGISRDGSLAIKQDWRQPAPSR
jgi:hypothetical protein